MGDWLVGNFMIFGVHSELDADRSGHYLGLDFPFLAVTALDASATW
jgi:hypothetical protein